jgi:peptidyl-prolyl cis-trans isomerase A (cyclophilin A)
MLNPSRRRALILLALAAPFAGPVFSAPAKRKSKMVKLHTNFGPITLELDAKAAPDTVANFLQYARDGHYDGTIFHRVIDGFMFRAAASRPTWSRSPPARPFRTRPAMA